MTEPTDPATSTARPLRVLTLNILHSSTWPTRQPAVAHVLHGLAPDLVALQETIWTPDHDQVAELLGPEYHVVQHHKRDEDGQGISIGSRWPIDAVHTLDLEVSPRCAGQIVGMLAVEIEVPPPINRVLFVNHFPSWQPEFEHERVLQAIDVSALIERRVAERPMAVVVAGDLDADPDCQSMRFWSGREALAGTSVSYLDAWAPLHVGELAERGETFTSRNPMVRAIAPRWPFRRIDYILVRRSKTPIRLDIDRCDVVFDQTVDGVWPSDHFGVYAELRPR